MTGAAEAWLPIDIAAREVVQSAIGRAIADWSTLWFPRPHVGVSGFKATRNAPRDEANGAGWKIYRSTVAVSCPQRSASWLVGWALDAQLDQLILKKADRRLLELFERTLIEDLAHKVELALGIESEAQLQPRSVRQPFDRRGGVTVSLSEDLGAPLLLLAVPLQALLPLCRTSMSPARREVSTMACFAQALGAADLTIEANLGHADVPVAELLALAPGDVLVLNRGLTDPIDVALAGHETAFARAKLIDFEGQMGLALQT